MTGLVDEGTAEDIAHLHLREAFDTVSLTAEQMEGGVHQKTENRPKGMMVSGTKPKWSPVLSNTLINDVDDGQRITTADRELGMVAGVLGGCAAIQAEMGSRSLLELRKEECKVLWAWGGRGTSICWELSDWEAAWQERSWKAPGWMGAKHTPVAKKVESILSCVRAPLPANQGGDPSPLFSTGEATPGALS